MLGMGVVGQSATGVVDAMSQSATGVMDAIGQSATGVVPPGQPATVLVAIRSAQVREALAALIGSVDSFDVVGEAASDEQALAIARSERPQVAVVDEELPGSELDSTIEVLHAEGLVDAVVAIGPRADGGRRTRAAGACAYVQMGASPADILSTLASALGS